MPKVEICTRCGISGHSANSPKCKVIISGGKKISGSVKITTPQDDTPDAKKNRLFFLFGKIK